MPRRLTALGLVPLALALLLLTAAPVSAARPLANDTFRKATEISIGTTTTLDTSRAKAQRGDPVPSCTSSLGATVWYKFTGAGKDVGIDTYFSDENYDTVLVVYASTASGLSEVACNNDSGSLDFTFQSSVSLPANAGTTYYILVGTYNGGPGGNLTLNTYNIGE